MKKLIATACVDVSDSKGPSEDEKVLSRIWSCITAN